jgi:phosphoribosylamine-glycine ligase
MPATEGEKFAQMPTWVSAGEYLVVVTGTGKTVKEAAERAYAIVKELHVPDMIYPDDIHEVLEEKILKSQEFGFATEFAYE